jgi:hypothetical protein
MSLAAAALILAPHPAAVSAAMDEVRVSDTLDVTLHLAVDDLAVIHEERRLVLTALVMNDGLAVELALCPALFFGGTVRPLQGYTYLAGDGVPDCTGLFDHMPTLGLSIDAIQEFPPACTDLAPLTATGDIITVPGASTSGPGSMVLVYEFLLADLQDGLELLDPAAVRARLGAAEGFHLDALTGINPEIAALICPSGVDTFLGTAPAAEVATLASHWLQIPVAAGTTVTVPTTLYSAVSFGADADGTAQVELLWEDNLATSLSGHLTHDPPAGTDFTLSPETFATGTLTANFPADLPEGFVGRATVRTAYTAGDGAAIADSVHIFAVDTTPPEIQAAHTARGDTDVDVDVQAADQGTGLEMARMDASVNTVLLAPVVMDYVSGDYHGPTWFTSAIGPATPVDVVATKVLVEDGMGNNDFVTLPVAAAGEDQVVECTSPAGALVYLDASGSTVPPVEEAETTYLWSNEFGTSNEIALDVQLSLGPHDIDLLLTDTREFTGTDALHVEVVDTTPPVIHRLEIPQSCLWPPNHKYVKYELGTDIIVEATDLCDPELDIRIVEVTSSQPDNGKGDGNTHQDVVWSDTATCVRSERQGMKKGGRTYTVVVEVADDSGNATLGIVQVRVAHSQKHHDCPALDAGLFIENGDPACDLHTADPGDPGTGDPGNGTVMPPLSKKAKKQAKKAARKAARQARKQARKASRNQTPPPGKGDTSDDL